MHIPKPAAALTSGLLARKGSARPAMRPSISTRSTTPVQPADDLGWNDMGDETAEASPVAVRISNLQSALGKDAERQPQAETPAKTKGAEIRQLFKTAVKAKAEHGAERKSAFTLRIDAERHLRLRLLSAVSNQSAQHLMIAALDALLAAHPDIEGLANDPKARSATKGKL